MTHIGKGTAGLLRRERTEGGEIGSLEPPAKFQARDASSENSARYSYLEFQELMHLD